MRQRTVAIDWAKIADISTAPLSAAQASQEAFLRALRLPPTAPMPDSVSRMLILGSPHLALARIRGVPFAPLVLSIPVKLGSRAGVSGRSSAVLMPTIVSQIAVRIVCDDGLTSNDVMVCELEGSVSVKGNPSYRASIDYVRLDSLVRIINDMPDSWILTVGQQIEMRVRSNRRLRDAVTVYFALRCWQPALEPEHPMWKLSNHEVLDAIEAAGYDVPAPIWGAMKHTVTP